jgi:calcium-dependent protein kinase
MNHPNVVKLIEVLATNSKIYIVLELCSGGDLFDKIKIQK